MASSGLLMVKVVACVVLMCMVVSAPPRAEAAVTCSQVSISIKSACSTYLTKGGAFPPGSCCTAVKSLVNQLTTSPCPCLLAIYKSIPGINSALANSLTNKCSAPLPGCKFSPSTDGSKMKVTKME